MQRILSPLDPPHLRVEAILNRLSTIANGDNTKVYVIKEPKLIVQMMDGVADQILRREAFELQLVFS